MDPFRPTAASTVSLPATSTTGAVALTLSGEPGLLIYNNGPNVAYVELGVSGVVATVPSGATPGSQPIPSGGWIAMERRGATHLAAICASTETATLFATPGRGL
jgi:hypothetical protein